jgi:pyrimidine operon attenuation protein/uracil phosphoribosyltransferase
MKHVLMDSNRIRRTVKRMSYQLSELAQGKSILYIGLNERGKALADELASVNLVNVKNQEVLGWNVGDNVTIEQIQNKITAATGVVVIVDDVLFSGLTMFKALKELIEPNDDSEIFICALVDRGHGKFPVRATVVGEQIPTKFKEHVEVKLKKGLADEVLLLDN